MRSRRSGLQKLSRSNGAQQRTGGNSGWCPHASVGRWPEQRRGIMRWLSFMVLHMMVVSSAVGGESSAKSSREPTTCCTVQKKSELPTGGEFVEHPKKPEVQYYFTNRLRMWNDKNNAQKCSGLYIPEDAGATWKILCRLFEFHHLFIHPETGRLYSVVYYT